MSERGKHKHSASATPSASAKLPTRYHTLRPTPSPSRSTAAAASAADRPFTASSVSYTHTTSPRQATRTISLNTPKAATTKAKHHSSASASASSASPSPSSSSTTTYYLSSIGHAHSASAASLFSTATTALPRADYSSTLTLTPRSGQSGQSRPIPDTPTRTRPAYSATLTPSSPTTSLAASPTASPIHATLPFASSSMQPVPAPPKCSACELPVSAAVKPVLITDKASCETYYYHQEHFCCHTCQLPLTTATLKRKQQRLYCPEHYPYPSCSQCAQLITGPSITALGRTYHPEHFTCSVCPTVITEAKFAHYDNKAYCAAHYAELERHCALCTLPVRVSDMKTTADRSSYHAACLQCWVCGTSKGTMLCAKGRMYCQPHGNALLYHRCAECGLHIDKPVTAPNGQYYHQDCLRCAVCQSVMDGWHTKLGQLRCGKHADMRSEAKDCTRCGRKVEAEEEVVKSMGRVYHSDCYKCSVCERRVDAKNCQLLDNAVSCVDCWLSRQPGQEVRRLPLGDSTAQYNNTAVPVPHTIAPATGQQLSPASDGEQNKQPASAGPAPLVKLPSFSGSGYVETTEKPVEESKEQTYEAAHVAEVVRDRLREHTRELSLSRSSDTTRLVQAIQGKALPPLPPLPQSHTPAPLNTSAASTNFEAAVSPSHGATSMPAPSPPTTPSRSAIKQSFASPSLGPVVASAPPTPPLLPTTPPLPSSRPFLSYAPLPSRPSTPTQVQLGDLIATGTFGSVYTALDQQTGEHLAVKVLKEHDLALLDHEVNLLKQLAHPNIVGFRGVREVDDKMHIYMEYVEGKSLVHQLARWGPFAEQLIRRYTRQLLSALAYCHDMRVTHRDIKGKNILVTTSGQVKLCDFGSAKRFAHDMTSEHPTKSYTFTVQWTAPEVVQGENKYGAKVDVWSLGCVLIEMASGKAPWSERMIQNQFRLLYVIGHTDDKPAIPATLSAECRQFIDLMLTKDPERRPTARELQAHPWLRDERPAIPQHVRSASAREEEKAEHGGGGGGAGARIVRGQGSISGEHRYAVVLEEQKEQLTTAGQVGQQRRSHSALVQGVSGLRLSVKETEQR